jgi:GR25 family glycosyltransferase involved in LPS biosynthesis
MLNDYVDKVFVINLPKRKDRILKFDAYAKKHGFEYEVFEAIDGKATIDDNFEYEGKRVGNPYVNPNYFRGQVGCLLSHLNLIKHSREMGYKKIMVFEDDCAFHDEFNQRLQNLFEKVNPDWQMLYLSGSVPEFTTHYDGYSRISSILTTHSYLIKDEIYDMVIENFEEKLFTNEVDVCYSHIIPNINSYVAMPYLTYQGDGYSDISEIYADYGSIKNYLNI